MRSPADWLPAWLLAEIPRSAGVRPAEPGCGRFAGTGRCRLFRKRKARRLGLVLGSVAAAAASAAQGPQARAGLSSWTRSLPSPSAICDLRAPCLTRAIEAQRFARSRRHDSSGAGSEAKAEHRVFSELESREAPGTSRFGSFLRWAAGVGHACAGGASFVRAAHGVVLPKCNQSHRPIRSSSS
jgi:hypothetical protein